MKTIEGEVACQIHGEMKADCQRYIVYSVLKKNLHLFTLIVERLSEQPKCGILLKNGCFRCR